MKFIFFLLVLSLLSNFCLASETDDAWVRKSAFDGRYYSYEVVAYGITGQFETKVSKTCNYGNFGKDKVLKSIDFKVYITGDFGPANSYSTQTGRIDVAKAVKDCLNSDQNVNKDMDSPVALNFPKTSVSSKYELNSL